MGDLASAPPERTERSRSHKTLVACAVISAIAAAVGTIVAVVSLTMDETDAQPRPTTTSASTSSSTPTYHVVALNAADLLTIRREPGIAGAAITEIPATQGGIVRTSAEAVMVGSRPWWEVRLPDGTVGWVNTRYLAEE